MDLRWPRRLFLAFRPLLVLTLLPMWGHSVVSAAPRASNATKWEILISAAAVRHPSGLAIDGRGVLHGTKWAYTTDSATGRVIKFGTGGRILASWKYGAPGLAAASIAVGGSGNVFVALRSPETILKFSPYGRRLARWSTSDDPVAIAIDPNGHLFEADAGTHVILERSPAGDIVQRLDLAAGFPRDPCTPCTNSGDLGTPTGVGILTPSPGIWISTTVTNKPGETVQSTQMDTLQTVNLRRYHGFHAFLGNGWAGLSHTADGTPTEVPGKESEPFAAIQGLTTSRRGLVYIAGTLKFFIGGEGHGLIAYSASGYKAGPWYLPSNDVVHGLAIDPQGFLYVAQGNRILKLRRTGGP